MIWNLSKANLPESSQGCKLCFDMQLYLLKFILESQPASMDDEQPDLRTYCPISCSTYISQALDFSICNVRLLGPMFFVHFWKVNMYIRCCWKNKELFECCCCDLELERTLKDVKVLPRMCTIYCSCLLQFYLKMFLGGNLFMASGLQFFGKTYFIFCHWEIRKFNMLVAIRGQGVLHMARCFKAPKSSAVSA